MYHRLSRIVHMQLVHKYNQCAIMNIAIGGSVVDAKSIEVRSVHIISFLIEVCCHLHIRIRLVKLIQYVV